MSKLFKPAFSLLEVLVCIVLLGTIGIVCGYVLLDMSKNLALQRKTNDQSYKIALLKLENILQTAVIESLSVGDQPLDSVFSQGSLRFISFERQKLFGGGDKTFTNGKINNDILLPSFSMLIASHTDSKIHFASLDGWSINQKLYLVSDKLSPATQGIEARFFSHNPSDIYTITHIDSNSLTLNHTPTYKPRLALPIEPEPHSIEFKDHTLWLDGNPLALGVQSFSITPHTFQSPSQTPQRFLEFTLCYDLYNSLLCDSGGVWLESFVEWL